MLDLTVSKWSTAFCFQSFWVKATGKAQKVWNLFSQFIRWKPANLQWKVMGVTSEGWLLHLRELRKRVKHCMERRELWRFQQSHPKAREGRDPWGSRQRTQRAQRIALRAARTLVRAHQHLASFPVYHTSIMSCYHHAKWSFVLTLSP